MLRMVEVIGGPRDGAVMGVDERAREVIVALPVDVRAPLTDPVAPVLPTVRMPIETDVDGRYVVRWPG